MIYFLGAISVLILILISVIHFYWAFGGAWGIDAVLPTKTKEQKVIAPPRIATIGVAIIMFGFALVYAEKIKMFSVSFFPSWMQEYGIYVIASIFIIRAIGEFNYVGFFKKVKNTRFAKNDSLYFSPLCLFLGVIGFLITTVM